MDVKELRKLEAHHVGGQSDGPPPSLAHLPEPGSPPAAEDQPEGLVEDGDSGSSISAVKLPPQAAAPFLAPADAAAGADASPHWKHCRNTQCEHNGNTADTHTVNTMETL